MNIFLCILTFNKLQNESVNLNNSQNMTIQWRQLLDAALLWNFGGEATFCSLTVPLTVPVGLLSTKHLQ